MSHDSARQGRHEPVQAVETSSAATGDVTHDPRCCEGCVGRARLDVVVSRMGVGVG